jgi:hypothetical protein
MPREIQPAGPARDRAIAEALGFRVERISTESIDGPRCLYRLISPGGEVVDAITGLLDVPLRHAEYEACAWTLGSPWSTDDPVSPDQIARLLGAPEREARE